MSEVERAVFSLHPKIEKEDVVMKKQGFRRIISLLLAVMMISTLLPMFAFAEGGGNQIDMQAEVVEDGAKGLKDGNTDADSNNGKGTTTPTPVVGTESTPAPNVAMADLESDSDAANADEKSFTFILKFDSNGGSGTFNDVTKTVDVTYSYAQYELLQIPAANTPTRDGYTFKGWQDKNGYDAVYQAGETVNVNLTNSECVVTDSSCTMTLHALWEENVQTYTVTYTDGVNGEEIFADQTYNVESGKATPAFNGTPSRESYTFIGWTPEVSATVEDNVVYTAVWESIQDYVMKNLLNKVQLECVNGGSSHSLKEYDSSVGLYSFIRYGNGDGSFICRCTVFAYMYVDQYSADTGKLHKLAAGESEEKKIIVAFDSYTREMKVLEGTLPVRFEVTCDDVVEHTVTYTDGVDGEEIFADQTYNVESGKPTPAFNGTPSREGYTFAGWDPAIAETVTESVTYTAQWTKASHTPTQKEINDLLQNKAVTVTCTNGKATHKYHPSYTFPLTTHSWTIDANYTPGDTACVIAIDEWVYRGHYIANTGVEHEYDTAFDDKKKLTITLTWDAANGKWTTTDSPAQIYVKCSNLQPEKPADDVVKALIKVGVMCDTNKNQGEHGTINYDLIDGSFSIGEIEQFENDAHICNVTIKADKYVAAYNKDTGSDHILTPSSEDEQVVSLIYKGNAWAVDFMDNDSVIRFHVSDIYTVTYRDGWGGTIFSDDVHAGVVAGTPTPGYVGGTPTHDGYIFIGWAPEVSPTVEKNAVYTAKWEHNSRYLVKQLLKKIQIECVNDGSGHSPKEYDTSVGGYSAVTMQDKDGKYTCTITVEAKKYVDQYSTDMGKPHQLAAGEPEKKTIIAEFYSYTGDVTVTSGTLPVRFEVTCGEVAPVVEHIVTYTDGVDGEEIFADQTYTVESGKPTPAFNGTPSRDGYTFAGWNPAIAETVTENVTYTAQWTKNEVIPPQRPSGDELDKILGQVTVDCISTNVPHPDGKYKLTDTSYTILGPTKEQDGEYVCKIYVDGQKYIQMYSETYGAHSLAPFDPSVKAIYLTASMTDTGYAWNMRSDSQYPIVFKVICDTEFRPDQPTAEDLKNLVKIVCDTTAEHPAKVYDAIDGGFTIGEIVAGKNDDNTPNGVYECTITIPAQPYVEKYNADVAAGHTLSDTEPQSREIKLIYTKEGGWVNMQQVTFHVVCETIPAEKHTVTYTDGVDESEIFKDQTYIVESGKPTPAFNGTPSRKGYTFAGWKPKVADYVTCNAIYEATWTANAAKDDVPETGDGGLVPILFGIMMLSFCGAAACFFTCSRKQN